MNFFLLLQLQVVNQMKNDILKGLSLYYHTFVDILMLKVK